VGSLTDKAGTQLKDTRFLKFPLRVDYGSLNAKNSKQNKMENADSDQPKAKKKNTKKGNQTVVVC